MAVISIIAGRRERRRPVYCDGADPAKATGCRRKEFDSGCGEHATPGNRYGIGRSRVPAFVRLLLTVVSRVSSLRDEPMRTLQKASFWSQHGPLRHTAGLLHAARN